MTPLSVLRIAGFGSAAVAMMTAALLPISDDTLLEGVDNVPAMPLWNPILPSNSLRDSIAAASPFHYGRGRPILRVESASEGEDARRWTLHTVGVVLGPRATAIIDGVPDIAAGVVVTIGDTVAGWVVTAITRDGVTVVAPDTTWTLPLPLGSHGR